MKTVGKCDYCKDPIYDFQELKVNGNVIHLHTGCLELVVEGLSDKTKG